MTYNSKEFGVADLSKESLQSLSFARQYWIPQNNGKPVSPSTVWRWIRDGVHGVRLAAAYAGRKPYTSQAAVQRFIAETTAKRAARLAATEGAVELASSLDLLKAGLIKDGLLPKRKGKK